MVVVLTIMSTLEGAEKSVGTAFFPCLGTTEGLHLQVRIPCRVCRFRWFLLGQLVSQGEQHQFPAQGREVAAGGIEPRRVLPEVLRRCYVCCQGAHLLVAQPHGKGIEHVKLYHALVVMGVGKGDAIAPSYIHIIYVRAHASHFLLLIVEDGDGCQSFLLYLV